MARKRPVRDDIEEKPRRFSPSRIAAFVRGAMLKNALRIELRHLSEDGSSRVRTWYLTGKEADAEKDGGEDGTSQDITHEILETAQEEANQIGGRQRYMVCWYTTESGTAYVERRIFVSDGEVGGDTGGEDFAPSESATPRGQLSQMMRHVESMARIAFQAVNDSTQHTHQIIQQQAARIQKYEEREMDVLVLREKLINDQDARELARAQEIRKGQLQDTFIGQLKDFAPVIKTRLLTGGKKGVKPPPALGEEQIRNLLKRLMGNPAKLEHIAKALDPLDMALMSELVRVYAEDEQKTNAANEANGAKKESA